MGAGKGAGTGAGKGPGAFFRGLTRRQKILAGAAVIAAAAVCAAVIRAAGSGVPVKTARAELRTVEDSYTEDGVISCGEVLTVTARVGGAVKEVLTEENAAVCAGDILFRIDRKDLDFEMTLAENTLKGLEAQLDQSYISQVVSTSPKEYLSNARETLEAAEQSYAAKKRHYEADQALAAAGALAENVLAEERAALAAAEAEMEAARNRLNAGTARLEELKEKGIDEDSLNARFFEMEARQLEAQVEAQKTRIGQISENLYRCDVCAEQDGVVAELPVKNLTVIQAGQTGAVLRTRGTAMAEADVLSYIAPRISPGDPVEITLTRRGNDLSCPGTVREVYSYAVEGVSSLGLSEHRVHVTADIAEGALPENCDGYSVLMKFRMFYGENCLTVPGAAVFTAEEDGASRDFLFAVRGGRAVRVPVTVLYRAGETAVLAEGGEAAGSASGNESTAAGGTISEGDTVIADADTEGLADGVKLKPEPE